MTGIDQQIVGQAERLELRDAATEGRAQQKPVVGLALDDVANTDQLWVRRESIELGPRVGRLQIEPPYHAGDVRMRIGQREQPPGLLDALTRLDRYAGVDTRARHLALRLVWQEVAAKHRHGV